MKKTRPSSLVVLTAVSVATLLISPSSGSPAGGPKCFGKAATIVGDGDLQGTAANDVIVGGSGADTVSGVNGGDRVCTGGGDDRVEIGSNSVDQNMVDGGAGNDWISYAQSQFDVSVRLDKPGRSGTNSIAFDVLRALENVEGSAFADRLAGGTGVNILMGGAGNDQFFWTPWDTGNDQWDGGQGTDLIDLTPAPGPATVDLAAGTASVAAVPASGTKVLTGIEDIVGSASDDTLNGNEEPNLVTRTRLLWNATGDDDTITTSGGNDHVELSHLARGTIDSGDGNDLVEHGGLGTTTSLGPGDDRATMIGIAAAGVQNMVSGGGGNDTLDGSYNADTLNGDDGVDILNGSDGDDTLNGGGGSDVMNGGAGVDSCAGNANEDATDGKCSFNGQPDFNTDPTPPGPSSDLNLKVSDPQEKDNGDLVYTLTVSNQGPDPAVKASIEVIHDGEIDVLDVPSGSTGIDCLLGTFDYTQYSASSCRSMNDLPVGDSLRFTARVKPGRSEEFHLLAVASSSAFDNFGVYHYDPDWSNNVRHLTETSSCPEGGRAQGPIPCAKVKLVGPEFVERGERFKLTATYLTGLLCEGDKMDLMTAVGGSFGVLATKEMNTSCKADFNVRVRTDTAFKARVHNLKKDQSPALMVKVR